jgi:uncharacterized protein
MGKKLKVLPPMRCDRGCGACCGFAPATETEYQAVRRYAESHGITPIEQGVTCPFYQDGQCSVYPVRPMICRVFGYDDLLQCRRGYNVDGVQEHARRMINGNGFPTRFLHELLPGWSSEKVKEALSSLAELDETLSAEETLAHVDRGEPVAFGRGALQALVLLGVKVQARGPE